MSEKKMTPGQLLISAREAQSLSIDDIAKQLRLSLQTIIDLEQDAYAKIGVRTYVRGYLCSYARIVNVPERQILEVFEASGLMPNETYIAAAIIEGAPVRNVTHQRRHFNFQLNMLSKKIIVGIVIFVSLVTILLISFHKKTDIKKTPAPETVISSLPLSPATDKPAESPVEKTSNVDAVKKTDTAVKNNGFVRKGDADIKKDQPLHTTYVIKPAE